MNVRDFVYVKDVTWAMHALSRNPCGPARARRRLGTRGDAAGRHRCRPGCHGTSVGGGAATERGFDVRRIVLDIGALQAAAPFAPTGLEHGVAAAWRALED